MSKYEYLYEDVFKNPKNYVDRKYHANGVFNKNPIFIGGSGRSGTTIIARTLSQHPGTLNFVEVRFLLALKNQKLQKRLPPFYKKEETYEKVIKGLRVAGYRNAGEVYSKDILKNIWLNDAATTTKRFFEIGLKAWNKSIIIEKTPHTFLAVNILYKIFPNLRYIHVFRDPRDIFASVKPLGWGPDSAIKFVGWYTKLMNRAYKAKREVPRKNYLLVRLEDLIYYTPKELKRIFKFTNLKYRKNYAKIITKENAHINRFKKELTVAEVKILRNGCNDIYTKWKKLYNKERRGER